MASGLALAETPLPLSPYSARVILKTILGRDDRGSGLAGQRAVIGGWVKSSKEEQPEPEPQPEAEAPATGGLVQGRQEPSCTQILQSRIPLFRSIIKVFGTRPPPVREKSVSPVPKRPPPPPTAILQVSDGSCVANLQVVVESSVTTLSKIIPSGTCILVEGVLQQPVAKGRHAIELKAEKIMHLGVVEQKYPLLIKRLPLENLRDFPHFRPRTTTAASVTRIHSALAQAARTYFMKNGFLYVQVPIITNTDGDGVSKKFHVVTFAPKKEVKTVDDAGGVRLETVKSSIEEKQKVIKELKRSESNKETLAVAMEDLKITKELVALLEATEKSKSGASFDAGRMDFEDLFSGNAYLTGSGRLHLESYACALGNVYSFGPRFSAEKSESKKHLAEMWMIEVEMAFSNLEDAMTHATNFLTSICQSAMENCDEDMKFLLKRVDRSIVTRLQTTRSAPFQRITYAEAVHALKEAKYSKFETKPELGVPLTEEQESYLADEAYGNPIIIHTYPKEAKPFYVRLNKDEKTVAAFDVIVPKAGALIRGSQNEERLDVLTTRIKEAGLAKEQYDWYLDLRRYGTVEHSGYSMAFDLLVQFATGLNDVRDVVPFPRTHGRIIN
ncbi:asparagine--tRNA ligase, cytoplasmic 2-like [Diospyros lotus]|uniref:asparagine--tRNA ligase, cytoplasmic 2-like n=1 Tax=Diospyros lotus TaxID=55363 RepID=UPI0022545F07|nr:asparagine--tRNA ligase, cytoplasmic 2-like [Diospyros lotus]